MRNLGLSMAKNVAAYANHGTAFAHCNRVVATHPHRYFFEMLMLMKVFCFELMEGIGEFSKFFFRNTNIIRKTPHPHQSTDLHAFQ